METKSRKNQKTTKEGRRIIASVYRFLKQEYEFAKAALGPNCDYLSHLEDILQRTADATGVSLEMATRIVSRAGKESASSSIENITDAVEQHLLEDLPSTSNYTPPAIKTENENNDYLLAQQLLEEERNVPSTSSNYTSPTIKTEKEENEFQIAQHIFEEEKDLPSTSNLQSPMKNENENAEYPILQNMLEEAKMLQSTSNYPTITTGNGDNDFPILRHILEEKTESKLGSPAFATPVKKIKMEDDEKDDVDKCD